MASSIPTIRDQNGVSQYLREIRQFPMLEPDEEFMLAKRWREHEDSEAAHRLITSHLRLVAKIAMGQRKKKTDVVEPQVIDEQRLLAP